jgi:hypothetical protein
MSEYLITDSIREFIGGYGVEFLVFFGLVYFVHKLAPLIFTLVQVYFFSGHSVSFLVAY